MSFPHNCNKTCCDHQSANDNSPEWNLLSKINMENLQCLNEKIDGSCKKIFRPWDDRLNKDYVNIKILNIGSNNFTNFNGFFL